MSSPRIATAARRAALLFALLLAGCNAATSDGFEFTAPRGWEDRTDAAETKTGVDYQAVYEGPSDGGIAANLLIDDVDPPEGRRRSLDDVVALTRRTVREDRGGRPGPVTETTLDGAPARLFEAESDSGRMRELIAQRGDRLYTVSLIASRADFDEQAPVFDRVLRSWRWDD